jgi:hypothetical protein
MAECTEDNAPQVCDDLNPCTGDTCNSGMCANAPSAPGSPCGGSMQSCDGSGTCQGGGGPIRSARIGDANVQSGQGAAVDGSGNVYVTGDFLGTADFGGGEFQNTKVARDAFVAKLNASGNHLWSKHVAGTGTTVGRSIAVDGSGNVVVTGLFDGSVDFGGGLLSATGLSRDVFVVKFDSSGNHVWSKRFGDLEDQVGQDVGVDGAGNVFLTGTFHNSIDFGGGTLTSGGSNPALYVAKLDDTGNYVWSKRFGGGDGLMGATGYQNGNSLAVSAAGRVFLFGSYAGTIDFGGGPMVSAGGSTDLFLAVLDGNAGDVIFSTAFGDPEPQLGKSIAIDTAGDLLLTGSFGGSLDFGGGPLVSMDPADIFVAKIESGANHLWSKRFGDTSAQNSYAIAADSTNNVLLSGSFEGSVDFGGGPLASAGKSDVFIARLDSTGSHVFSKSFGDGDLQESFAVAAGASGDAVITGSFQGNTDFGGGVLSAGSLNVFIAKYGSAGDHVFSKQSGIAVDQHADSITADSSDNACVLGSFDGILNFTGTPLASKGNIDIFVASLDGSGNALWAKGFGDLGFQAGTGIVRDSMGDLLLTGAFANSIDFGGGPLPGTGLTDIFLAKLDIDGAHVFSKSFGDALEQRAEGIAVDAADNMAITGFFTGTVNFGGNLLINGGGADIFVAKFDPIGGHLFSKQFGDPSPQRGASIAMDSSGALFVTGSLAGSADFGGGAISSAGGTDIFVVKLDGAGNHVYSKRFGDDSDQFGDSIAVDGSGNAFVTGRFAGSVDFGTGLLTSAGGNDVFLVKLDPAGNAVFGKRAGDAAEQRGDGLAVDGSGNTLVTGRFAGALDFGGGPVVSAGSNDVFIAKFDSAGNLLWRKRAGDASAQHGSAVVFGGSGKGFATGDFFGTIDLGSSSGSQPLVSGPTGSDGFLAHFGP